MNGAFLEAIATLQPQFEQLLAMAPVKYGAKRMRVPQRGVYLFSENGKYLYVGRSNRLRSRLAAHCVSSSTHLKAAFAFRLAREATANLNATYTTDGSRAMLMKDETFRSAFETAKARIRNMEIRYVEEADPLRQALLEMFVAVSLQTRYNDFDNH